MPSIKDFITKPLETRNTITKVLRQYSWLVGIVIGVMLTSGAILLASGAVWWARNRDDIVTPTVVTPTASPTMEMLEPSGRSKRDKIEVTAPPRDAGEVAWKMTVDRIQDGLKLVSHSEYTDSSNNLWIVMEVQNLTDEPLGQLKVVFYIEDLMEVRWSSINRIEPGGTAPMLSLISAEDLPPDVSEYAVTIGAEKFEKWAQGYYYYDLKIENDRLGEGQFADIGVAGEIVNVGESKVEHTKAFAAFYDEDGTIIYTNYDFIDTDILRPGKSDDFSIDMRNRSRVAVSYKLWVEASVAD